MDINKRGTEAGNIKIPESAGLVSSSIYLVFNMISIGFIAHYLPSLSKLHLASLFSITFTTLLGFVDDVLDLRWRYKMVLPPLASLPLLVIYDGPTLIIVPA